jgi:hypothetical protein
MSEQIATFFNAKIGTANYLFLVTNNSAFDIEIRKALLRSVPKFGKVVAEKARISTIHDGSERRAYDELLQKKWPADVLEELDVQNSPFVVVINKDFETFDPAFDEWFIIWLAALGRPRSAIPPLFDRLAREIVAGRDVFAFLTRTIEEPNSFFRAGTIWSRHHSDGLATPLRAGRPPIVRDELLRKLDKLLVDNPYYGRDWRKWYATEARRWLEKHGEPYLLRSVRDALNRANWFEYAERILKSTVRVL